VVGVFFFFVALSAHQLFFSCARGWAPDSLENSEIDKNEKKTVSRVSYLDKHPWFVFVFEVMSEDEIAEKKRLFAKIEEKEPLEAENFARNHCSVVYTPSKSNHEVLVTRNLASALPGAMQAASLQNSLERAGWQPSW